MVVRLGFFVGVSCYLAVFADEVSAFAVENRWRHEIETDGAFE